MLWKFALSSIAFLMMPVWVMASLMIGVSKAEITPPINSPSAGYARNTNMIGVYDPLWAMALFIDNPPRISKEEQCSVISKTLSQTVQNIFTSVREIETTVDKKQEYIH
ncbi:hypothetical protein [Candidatus Rhabdochlamydia porcellionis]|jgi:hypothetical protein|uniref:Uncharacterized protein n=1 Tax=Candidatus Rhabdochlamydia porcellionis TaxID=225148 RepID=A0ABX8Z0T8_9BACT|nr:hypothetical protein [Candidatus Rhabdochlamydia porcellionis]QZA58955.1 hypothetical protein RHAB15C_0000838 [Candidatus Rhabdochlamydia porcellionis]